jgi:hypothetical protein
MEKTYVIRMETASLSIRYYRYEEDVNLSQSIEIQITSFNMSALGCNDLGEPCYASDRRKQHKI